MIKAILTDIEGTTTSLSFVKDVLFPHARQQMDDFIRCHGDNPELSRQLAEVRHMTGLPDDTNALIQQLTDWIDADCKITPLKAIQGMIWEAGYRRGDFFGHVYPDAAACLKRWKQQGFTLGIFSSGSVQAQKLLFAHTEWGDLTPLFAGYYDTRTGAKQEADSYRQIAGLMGFVADEMLFLSDVVGELDAARDAGMHTCQLLRETGMVPGSHRQAKNFDDVNLLFSLINTSEDR